MAKPYYYRVIVGNVGQVACPRTLSHARRIAKEYETKIRDGEGRAEFPIYVTSECGGEIVLCINPTAFQVELVSLNHKYEGGWEAKYVFKRRPIYVNGTVTPRKILAQTRAVLGLSGKLRPIYDWYDGTGFLRVDGSTYGVTVAPLDW